jgi:hypothetical protein
MQFMLVDDCFNNTITKPDRKACAKAEALRLAPAMAMQVGGCMGCSLMP